MYKEETKEVRSNGPRVLVVSSDSGELRRSIQSKSAPTSGWIIETVGSPESALLKSSQKSFDVVVVDSEFGTGSSLSLLNSVVRSKPETIRFVCGSTSDVSLLGESLRYSHRVFASVPDAATLFESIDVALVTQTWLLRYHQALESLVPRMRVFPSPPDLYFKVLNKLLKSGSSLKR